jgi:mannose PTS system EIIA component
MKEGDSEMDNHIAIILMSHGNFAKSAIESAELIVGKQENCDTVSVFLVDQVDELRQEMFNKVDTLDTSNGLLVLTDIVGGTPTNLALNLLDRENTLICSGLNLPMLLEVLINRDKSIDELKDIIENAYNCGMVVRTINDLEKEDDNDDLL